MRENDRRHQGRLTQRLRLELVRPDGVADLLRLQADPGVAAWNGGAWSPARAKSFADDMAERWNRDGAGTWLAYDRSDGRLVGRGGLSSVELLGQRRLEVGWQIREQLWGRGFATEIGRAALELAFSDMHADQVVAFTEAHNVTSRRVMERLGMHYLQQFHRRGRTAGAGEVRDDAVFVLYGATSLQ